MGNDIGSEPAEVIARLVNLEELDLRYSFKSESGSLPRLRKLTCQVLGDFSDLSKLSFKQLCVKNCNGME